jgi:hypothetical protein
MTEATRVRELNDSFRTTFGAGQVMMTSGVAALPYSQREAVLAKVRTYDDFTADNDPHGEHDFGNFELAGEKFFWKIDYYDTTMDAGSEDPADPSKTVRVLTIMLADEY